MARRLTAISLYTGAGGLDLGIEAAGFKVVAAVEADPDCVATLRGNREWPVFADYIQNVGSNALLSARGLAPTEPDLLIGGPPCQPFSKCGYWATGDTKRLDDPRADTVEAFLRVLRDARPRAFLMENVTGMAYSGKDEEHRGSGLASKHRDPVPTRSWSISAGRFDVLTLLGQESLVPILKGLA